MSTAPRNGRRKTGLKTRRVDPNHWSSGVAQSEDKAETSEARVVVRFLEARELLASDAYSGKSDPICFAFLCEGDEASLLEMFDDAVLADQVKSTKVVAETVDPVWNEEATFLVRADATVQHLEETWLAVLVRDEDIEDDEIMYDELGMVRISLRDVATNGKYMHHMCVCPPSWYPLQKWGDMSKVAGRIKLAVTLAYGNQTHQTTLQTFAEAFRAKDNSNAASRDRSRSPSKQRRSTADILKRAASSRRELSPYRPERQERHASDSEEAVRNSMQAKSADKAIHHGTESAFQVRNVEPEELQEAVDDDADDVGQIADELQPDDDDDDEQHPELEPPPPAFDTAVRSTPPHEKNAAPQAPVEDTIQEDTALGNVHEQESSLPEHETKQPTTALPEQPAATTAQVTTKIPSKPAAPRMASIANMVRTAQVLKRGRVDVDKTWVAELLATIDKLGDRSTEKVGIGVALHLLQNPRPAGHEFGETHFLQLLGAARKAVENGSLSLRKNIIDLLRLCMIMHAGSCSGRTSLSALLAFMLQCIHHETSASVIKVSLAELCGVIPLVVGETLTGFYEKIVQQLQACLSQQSVIVQELACACIAALYRFPEPPALVFVANSGRALDISQLKAFMGAPRLPTGRKVDLKQPLSVDTIDPAISKPVGTFVEVPSQDWQLVQQQMEKPPNRARFQFRVLSLDAQRLVQEARAYHVQFLVNSGVQSLVSWMSQYVGKRNGSSSQASVGLLSAFQHLCENCSGGSGKFEHTAELGAAVADQLPALLPILTRVFKHTERSFWKSRSAAASTTAMLCVVEACVPAIRESQAQLQTDLRALMSDPIAEVRQSAKHALHALEAIGMEEANVDEVEWEHSDFPVNAGDEAQPDGQTTPTPDAPNAEAVLEENEILEEAGASPSSLDIKHSRKSGRLGENSTQLEPSLPRAGGNSTHTARMLKKLGTQTMTLQAMVDDLTIQTRQSMEMLKKLTPKHAADMQNDYTDISVASTATEEFHNGGRRSNRSPPQRKRSPSKFGTPEDLPQPHRFPSRPQHPQDLWRHVNTLLQSGDVNRAFQDVLAQGRDKDVVQLMQSVGACPERLDDPTREQLLVYAAGLISRGASLALALPWMYNTVSKDCVRFLSPDTRDVVANSLHQLAAVPTEHGVIAARLHRYFIVK